MEEAEVFVHAIAIVTIVLACSVLVVWKKMHPLVYGYTFDCRKIEQYFLYLALHVSKMMSWFAQFSLLSFIRSFLWSSSHGSSGETATSVRPFLVYISLFKWKRWNRKQLPRVSRVFCYSCNAIEFWGRFCCSSLGVGPGLYFKHQLKLEALTVEPEAPIILRLCLVRENF